MAEDVLAAEPLEELHRGAQAHGLGDRHRAGLELPRQLVPRRPRQLDGADHLAAAEERRHGLEQRPPAPERTNARGPEHLVRRTGEEVDPERRDVDRHVRGALRRVENHRGAVGVRDARDLGHRIHGAEHVRDVHERDQFHFAIREELRQDFEVQLAGAREWNEAHLELPLGREHLPRHEVRMVLHRRQEQRISRLERPAAPRVRDQVQSLGRVAREHDLAGARPEERGQAPARILVERGGLLRDAVDAAVDVRVAGRVIAVHRVEHGLRLLRRRGAVEVDERLRPRRVEDRELLPHLAGIEGGRRLVGRGCRNSARHRHQPILRSISPRRRSRTASSGIRSITGSKNASTMSRCASSRGRPRAMR